LPLVPGYNNTQTVANLAPGDSVEVSFVDWTASPRGLLAVRCSTDLSGDQVEADDTLRDSVMVRVRDVACTQLLAPRDTVDSGSTVTPQAIVQNLGNTSETFDVRFAVGTGYADTVPVTLLAGATDTVEFAGWTALLPGTFPTLCATLLAADMNAANDSLADSVTVETYTGVAEQQFLPRVLALERPAPDPMRGQATIRFTIPRRTQLALTVRSVTGSLVRTLASRQSLGAGIYSLSWDGRDDHGRSVAPGIYLWRLEAEDKVLTRKAVKIN